MLLGTTVHWGPFPSVAVILAVAVLLAAAGFKLRQPLIISFLAAGILVGPSGLNLLGEGREIELFAEMGVALLLFVVGLRLDVGMIRTVGPVALATGVGQVLFTSAGGFALAMAFGMELVPAAYTAVALTFSSTIIIVKLLSDKKEIDSLHGRIAIGFLIVQDIAAILALIALTAFGGDAEGDFASQALGVFAKGAALLAFVYAFMRWGAPRLTAYLARSQELLVLSAIAWAVLLAAAGEMMGFSKEVGAFLAGVSLASTEQRDAIGARLVVLRDFLLLFFFIVLGARLKMEVIGAELGKAAAFSLFVLIGNPLIVMAIMGLMGYRRRTGFMCGLTVAQISEFSLILVALGATLGHVDQNVLGLVTLVGLGTICVSTYMILYSGPLYARLSPYLKFFEKAAPNREIAGESPGEEGDRPVILVGLGDYGSKIADHLLRRGQKVLALDFDPQALQAGQRRGLAVMYGDAADPEVLSQLPLNRANWVVCTAREPEVHKVLLQWLRASGFAGRVAVAAASPEQAEAVRSAGAHVVLEPFSAAAEQAADVFTGAMQALPGLVDWPAALREVPLPTGSVHAGRTIRDIALRNAFGVTVLAVSRAGRVHFNPPADFRLFPGDRVAVIGAPDNVAKGAETLGAREEGAAPAGDGAFAAAEIAIAPSSPHVGKTLADLKLREEYDATIVGIHRGAENIHAPGGTQRIEGGDVLVVVGSREAVNRLKSLAPL